MPKWVILHYTAMNNAAEAIERLCDPAHQVSAHYVISECGAVTQLVPEGMRAWHAAKKIQLGQQEHLLFPQLKGQDLHQCIDMLLHQIL